MLTLASDVTAAMKPGRYVYDVEIVKTSDGKVTRVVEGQIEIMPGVTSNAYDPGNVPSGESILDGGIY